MAMRGSLWRALAAGFLVLLPLGAAAQEVAASPARVAAPLLTLDEERLFVESRFGQALVARNETDKQALIAENREIEAALEREEKDLTARRAAMTREEFQPLSAAFDAKVEEIRKAQDAKSRDLTRRFEEERARLFSAVRPVLAKLMLERGAVAIIDKRAVLVGFENVDITTAAIQALDAAIGDGSLPEAPGTPTPAAPTSP